MRLRNRIERMAALLLAGVLLLTAGQGTKALAGESMDETEDFLWTEEELEGEVFQSEIIPETMLAEAETSSGGRYPAPEEISDAAEAGGISIDDVTVVGDLPGSTDGLSGDEGVRNETYIHRVGLAGDTSGAASSGGVSAIAGTAVYETCYGDQLGTEARKVYDEMKKRWAEERNTGELVYKLTESVPVSGSSHRVPNNPEYMNKAMNAAQCATDAFLYDYPEVFWIRGTRYRCSQSTSYDYSSGGTIATYEVDVTISCGEKYYEGAPADVTRFDSAVSQACGEIRAGLPSGSSREATVRAIHDYVCNRVVYRESSYAHTAAGFFLYPGAGIVCEGYAKAFKILCDRFGIECALVVGNAGEDHMWNLVKMEDGLWYLVDTTWDDQDEIGEVTDTYFLAGSTTIGHHGLSIGQERVIHKRFSNGANTMEFEPPVLSGQKYGSCVHEWQEDSLKSEAPSCEEEGAAAYICQKCGSTKTEPIPALGHTWGAWTTRQEATVLLEGIQERSCSACGNVQTQNIPRISGVIELNVENISLKTGQSSEEVRVTGMTEGDSVESWESSDPRIVSVDSKTGRMTGNKAGSAKVTVTLKSGISASVMVTVQDDDSKTAEITETTEAAGITEITVTAKKGTIKNKKLTLKKGSTDTLVVTLIPASGSEKVSFSSSNSKVVKVSKKGKLTGKKKGTAKITVKAGKKKVVIKVTVK